MNQKLSIKCLITHWIARRIEQLELTAAYLHHGVKGPPHHKYTLGPLSSLKRYLARFWVKEYLEKRGFL